MKVLIIAICMVSVSQGTILRLLNRTRQRGGFSGLGQTAYGQPGARPSFLSGLHPRANEAPSEVEGDSAPVTRYTKHTQKTEKTEKTESYSSQKTESHISESTSYSSSGPGGLQRAPAAPQSETVPTHTGEAGGVAQTADVAQQVGGDQLGGSGVSPRHVGGVRQTAHIQQSAASHGGGAVRQSANVNQAASGGGHGVDQAANIGQQVSSRSAPSSAATIRQTANVQQLGGRYQHVHVKQNAKIRQGGPHSSASISQTANVQQTAGSSSAGGGEGTGAAGEGTGAGSVGSKLTHPPVDGDCGANSAYCVNVNDEGFYPSTDARGHFYRCSHCSPHFFRCGPGTAYHVASRACL